MDLFDEINGPHPPFYLSEEDGYSYKWDEKSQGFVITLPNGELF